MANLVYSIQRDDEGNAQFTPQQISVSRGAVFSMQRSMSGNAIFSSQYSEGTSEEPAELAAHLISNSVVTITLQTDPDAFFVRMSSDGTLTSALSISDLALVAQLKSVGRLLSAVLTDTLSVSASLKSVSTLSVNLQASDINMRTLILASSKVAASLYFTSGSNIPRNAKLKAIPLDADTLQIVRYRGDTYADAFVVYNDKTGEIVDLTGCTFKMSLATYGRYNPFREIIYTLYGTVDSADTGVVSFAPNADQANRVGFYYYDVEMRDSQDVVRTLVSSSYVYKMDITP